ncbi:MAG: DUF4124 domain-containing protein [Chromatiales bacterium]|jgi:hypothetical protein
MRKALYPVTAFLTLAACAWGPIQAATEVYKRVGPDGTVIFSDEPGPGASRVEVQPPATIELPDLPPPDTVEKQVPEQAPAYSRLAFVSPTPDEAVRANDGIVEVQLALDPALRTEAGHRIEVALDNEVVRENAPLSFKLENMERGTHSLTATVVDAEGNAVIPAQGVTFHVLKVAAARPAPR